MKSGNNRSGFKLLWEFLIYTLKIEPKIFISFIVVTISTAISTVLMVYLPKIVIDGVMGTWSLEELTSNLIKYSSLIIIFKFVSYNSEHKFLKDRNIFVHKMGATFSKKF